MDYASMFNAAFPTIGYNASTSATMTAPMGKTYPALEDNGAIYRPSADGKIQVGVTMDVYHRLVDSYNAYQQELIKLGAIEAPMTQDEINSKLLKQLAAMDEKLTALQGGQINGFKSDVCGSGAVDSAADTA